jgi:hypothetical protein
MGKQRIRLVATYSITTGTHSEINDGLFRQGKELAILVKEYNGNGLKISYPGAEITESGGSHPLGKIEAKLTLTGDGSEFLDSLSQSGFTYTVKQPK